MIETTRYLHQYITFYVNFGAATTSYAAYEELTSDGKEKVDGLFFKTQNTIHTKLEVLMRETRNNMAWSRDISDPLYELCENQGLLGTFEGALCMSFSFYTEQALPNGDFKHLVEMVKKACNEVGLPDLPIVIVAAERQLAKQVTVTTKYAYL